MLEHMVRPGKGLFHVPEFIARLVADIGMLQGGIAACVTAVGVLVLMQQGRAFLHGLEHVENGREILIRSFHGIRRHLCFKLAFRDDEGDGFPVIADPAPGQERLVGDHVAEHIGQHVPRDDGTHAGKTARLFRADLLEQGMRMAGTRHGAIQHVGKLDVRSVDRLARDPLGAVDADDTLANVLTHI